MQEVHEDTERCVRAVRSKDARFDGWFFTAVLTTRIYCRPSCPVVPPKAENMRFLPSAAAAQQAGFRACKRCRPDASPGSPRWNERADLVARAMRLIADGVVDRDGVDGLAQRLGYSVRQVQRQLLAELGAGPLALARAQRAQTARLLIETSALPMGEVALAAGFASLRTFNDTVREVFAMSPTELRRRAGTGGPASGSLSLRLPFRAPLHADGLFATLAAEALPGVEEWRDGAYRRTLRLPNGPAIVSLRPMPGHIAAELSLTDLRDLHTAINRCRRLLDLDADPEAVDALLAEDAALAPLIAANPGRRVPRTVDGAEFAIRAFAGEKAAALVAKHGEPVDDPGGGLSLLFPEPAALVDEEPVAGLARALTDGELELGAGSDWTRARQRLAALGPGVDPGMVELIAMRALGDPDAFPRPGGGQRWRPWRAYAAQYLEDGVTEREIA
ncbi:bifunctional transcriptional activator/DNA repair enzyme AdaA [Amycolatopsis sp. YIM 10]|uniref:bifunctional transcriptional activator/DNA repair enzyme AdaA n=1 Tax=Amycolatopsis sp. YIM 10 TaxID=2653857 RepID=UPI00129001C3|nr:AlkA N-terminal domain-containing protein [Amycolatopsis sp. YIM 10]